MKIFGHGHGHGPVYGGDETILARHSGKPLLDTRPLWEARKILAPPAASANAAPRKTPNGS